MSRSSASLWASRRWRAGAHVLHGHCCAQAFFCRVCCTLFIMRVAVPSRSAVQAWLKSSALRRQGRRSACVGPAATRRAQSRRRGAAVDGCAEGPERGGAEAADRGCAGRGRGTANRLCCCDCCCCCRRRRCRCRCCLRARCLFCLFVPVQAGFVRCIVIDTLLAAPRTAQACRWSVRATASGTQSSSGRLPCMR